MYKIEDKLTIILVRLLIVCSFFSYEIHIYRTFYQKMIMFVFFIGLSIFILNISNDKVMTKFLINLYNNKKVFLLSFIIVLSTFFSSVSFGLVSFSSLIVVIITIISIYIFFIFIPVVIEDKRDKIFKELIWLISLFSIISILIALNGNFLGYTETQLNRYSSIFFDPNYFGAIAVVGFFLSLDVYGFSFFSVINIVAIYLTGSRTALIGVVLVSIVFYFLGKKITIKNMLILLILSIALYFMYTYLNRTTFFRVDQGLNSRDFLWSISFDLIKESPIYGYGYGTLINLLQYRGATNASSHNSNLDYIMMYGIPVFVMNLLVISSAIFKGFKKKTYANLLKIVIFLLFTSNSISLNIGGIGALSLLFTIFLGLCNLPDFSSKSELLSKN